MSVCCAKIGPVEVHGARKKTGDDVKTVVTPTKTSLVKYFGLWQKKKSGPRRTNSGQNYKLITSSGSEICRQTIPKPSELIGSPNFHSFLKYTPRGCRHSVRSAAHSSSKDIRHFTTPKSHTRYSEVSNFSGIWKIISDTMTLDSPSCLDSKKVWVWYAHVHSKSGKRILAHAPVRNAYNQSQYFILSYT